LQPLKAHVENGRVVLDESTDLPDGTVLYVVPEEGNDGLTPEERQAIRQEIALSIAEEKAGGVLHDADAVRDPSAARCEAGKPA
jgi:hypothetical protein